MKKSYVLRGSPLSALPPVFQASRVEFLIMLGMQQMECGVEERGDNLSKPLCCCCVLNLKEGQGPSS